MDKIKSISDIYQLSKEELIKVAKSLDLETFGTLDELRSRTSSTLKLKLSQTESKTGETQSDKTNIFEKTDLGGSKNGIENTERDTDEATIIDKVRKWNLFFDGQKDVILFLERLEELRNCYRFPDTYILRALPEVFRGNALLWYRNNHKEWEDWHDFLKDFSAFFLPRNYKRSLMVEICKRTQKNNEKFKDFVVEIQTLIRRQGTLSKEQELEQIYLNMRPEYKRYIKRKEFDNLLELIEAAEEYESLQKELNEARVPPNRNSGISRIYNEASQSPTVEHVDRIRNYDRNTFCWRCGQRGHSRPKCFAKSKLFCSYCGLLDVLTRDCLCHGQKQGNETAARP